MPFLHRVLLVIVLLFICFSGQLLAQPERLAQAKAIVSELQTTGVRLERPHVVVYFEAGLIPEADQTRWAGLISKGIDDIESFLNASFESTKLEYYVSSRVRDTSFSIPGYDGPPRVFLASDRVVRGAAPYIHDVGAH
jgi:hypothetical protein